MVDFNKITMKEFSELCKTEAGREKVLNVVKNKLEEEETIKTMQEIFTSFFETSDISEIVKKLDSISKFVDHVTSLPEDEAKNYLEGIFNQVYNSSEVSEAEKKEIIEQWYKKPDSFTQPLTKAVERIFDGKTDFSEPTGLKVGDIKEKNGKKTPAIVNAQVFLSVLDSNGAMLPKCLTPYDREVFNGYCSILASGQQSMTTRQIYEAMTGKPTTSPQALGAITKSIRKMQTTLVSIDWTAHAKMKHIELNEDDYIRIEEPVIPARGVHIRTNGQDTTGYMAYAEPSLFAYAKAVGQISTTKKEVLTIETVPNVCEAISNTEENIVIKNYLLRHIEHLKKSKKWNPVLKFETIFTDCGIKTAPKNLPRKREVIFNILNYWKWIGYIKDYDVEKKGRAYYSLKIKI